MCELIGVLVSLWDLEEASILVVGLKAVVKGSWDDEDSKLELFQMTIDAVEDFWTEFKEDGDPSAHSMFNDAFDHIYGSI